jgi:hypothetical protein
LDEWRCLCNLRFDHHKFRINFAIFPEHFLFYFQVLWVIRLLWCKVAASVETTNSSGLRLFAFL